MTQKLSIREKIGYSLGDLAANFVFQFMITLQLVFYVDVYGLPAADAANMCLVVGLGVAFLNPIMGVIADRTNSKWGKFRPWLLWTALPFGIIGVATFTTPDLGNEAKLVYAWITYTLLRVIYVVNNVPYATMTAVMTADPDERTSISTYRQVAANSAGFIIGSLAWPLIKLLGQGDPALGFQLTMGILMIVSMAMFVVAFLTTKERIQPDPAQKTSLIQDMADLFANRAFVMLFLVTLFYFVAVLMRGNAMLPYFKFYVGDDILFSWFNGVGLISLIVGVMCSTAVSRMLGKRRLFIVSMLLTAGLTSILVAFPPQAHALIIVSEGLRQFAFGLSGPILWAMMGDVADYGEWKTGRRASATVTSAVVFALWVGLALGQAIAGWLFSSYGYAEKAASQSAEAVSGIVLTGGLYAGLAFFAAAAFLFLYPLSAERTKQIADELIERRKGFSSN